MGAQSDSSSLRRLSKFLKAGDKEVAQATLDAILSDRKAKMDAGRTPETKAELKVYVAGPYTPYGASLHDAAKVAHENTVAAINAGLDVVSRGHFPYVPHLSHFTHIYGKKTFSYKYYMDSDMKWLHACDAILFYRHVIGASSGADNELREAIDKRKQIFFFAEEIPQNNAMARKFNE